MAYTVIVEKQPTKKLNKEDYNISVSVVVKDGEDTIIDEIISGRYQKDTSPDTLQVKALLYLKDKWATYLLEQEVYADADFDTACKNIESEFSDFINQEV